MLYADKAALANRARVRMIEIREHELNLYTQNSRTIASTATLIAGMADAALLYNKMPYYQEAGWFTKHFYPLVLTLVFGFAILSVLNFNLIAMFGPGLALRGPDGSVHVAIEHITVEYRTASFFFAIAITCFHFAVVVYVWGSGPPLATKVMLTCLAAYSLFQIAKYSIDTSKQFWVEKAYTGAFSDEPVPSRPPRPAGDTGKSPQPAPQPATHLFNAAAIRSDACGSPGPAGFGAAPTIVPRSYSSADFAHGPDGTVPRSLSQGWMPESCERISQLSTSVAASAVARGSGAATAAASSISALSSILRARTKSGTHPPPADASGGSVRAGASRAGSSCTSPAPGAATSALGSPAQAARLGAGDHAAATGASGAQTAAGPRDAGAGGTMY